MYLHLDPSNLPHSRRLLSLERHVHRSLTITEAARASIDSNALWLLVLQVAPVQQIHLAPHGHRRLQHFAVNASLVQQSAIDHHWSTMLIPANHIGKISHLEPKLGRSQPSRLITEEVGSISRVVKAHHYDVCFIVLDTPHHEVKLGRVADDNRLIVIYILVDAPGPK